MSRVIAEVRRADGPSWYGIFDGTTDFFQAKIYPEKSLAVAAWEAGEPRTVRGECSCETSREEEVTLTAPYGSGVEMESEACFGCGVITGIRDPYWEPHPDRSGWGFVMFGDEEE
jgi:hypothetical protein